jgi:hypothetical protein
MGDSIKPRRAVQTKEIRTTCATLAIWGWTVSTMCGVALRRAGNCISTRGGLSQLLLRATRRTTNGACVNSKATIAPTVQGQPLEVPGVSVARATKLVFAPKTPGTTATRRITSVRSHPSKVVPSPTR